MGYSFRFICNKWVTSMGDFDGRGVVVHVCNDNRYEISA